MRSPAAILTAALLAAPVGGLTAQNPAVFRVGAARVDVTPQTPIRLSGYGGRRAESDGVVQKLYARALAVDDGAAGPALLISVDNVAVPGWLVEQTAAQLQRELRLPRERLAIVSTHTHTGPMLRGAIPNMFGADVPAEHQQRIDQYTDWLGERLLDAARQALANLQPGSLAIGRGSAPFAANRRTAGGPVDHELPFLAATGADGALVALVANYACHCTTLGGGDNAVCGDWAGYAAESLEQDHPGAVALITIGCGADANPASYGLEQARAHGRALADEVGRVLGAGAALQPLPGPLRARLDRIRLPFDRLPTREEWRARLAQGGAVAYHAQKNLERLERGEAIPQELEYPVAAWSFGDDLAMVFLGGEVVVDYALRLKREFDASRLWITAYANDVPCYIPSERILREGGYEAEGAMVYYDRPARLQSGVEQRIVDAVRAQVPESFRVVLGVDVGRTEGVAPKTPAAARAALRAHAGLRVELVAAEPLVESPVALDFGPDGSLWVCEMRDYPSGMDGDGEPGGRIVVLRDTDGDGLPDQRRIFLENLPFPTGVTVWRDGALVCASNDILYAADTDRDGRADEVRSLYSGFRTDNFQARVNSLELGLDGWYWGASGLPTGAITSFAGGPALELGGRDFRIRPETGAIEAAAGLTQQGRCRDDFGSAFGCDNSTLLRHYPLDERYLRRNPHLAPPPAAVLVPRDADANRVFPLSRILARFNDPDAAGRVTSGCGIGIYRDDLLGAAFAGNSFTCEPVHNLVTRLVLEEDGATFAGARAPEESASEFLASTDPWFRPVQARTGPDGALYVVDMARFVIEHPDWIPAERLAELDVRAGAKLGRIWRIVPADRALRPVPNLDQLDSAGLVAALDTPNGTVRDLVQARLAERDSIAPAEGLRRLARGSAHPAAVVQALCALDQLGALRAEDLLAALQHAHPGVRRNAVRLSERWLDRDAATFDAVLALAEDPDVKVRLQAACSLGESSRFEAGAKIAAHVLADEPDEYLRAAWFSSVLPHLGSVLSTALILDSYGTERSELIVELVGLAVQSGDGAALAAIRARIGADAAAARWSAAIGLAAACLEAADRLGSPFESADLLAPLRPRARAAAADRSAPPDARRQAIQLLGRESRDLAADLPVLAALLGGAEDVAVQEDALAALARIPDPRAASALLDDWDRIGPGLRPAVLDALLAREAFVRVLLEALPARPDLLAALDPARRLQLREHPVAALRARAAQLLAAPASADREAVLARYAGVRDLAGNPARGAARFAADCGLCHRLDGVGAAVGPDLAALSDRSAQTLLVAILDPNRAINPEYVNYAVSTRDGRFLSGLIRDESAGSLRLVSLGGSEVELMRSNVLTIADTRASLMPVGLETVLQPAAMADLIAYLQTVGAQPKSFPGNRPAPIAPLADGSLLLPASQAALYGDSLVFEAPFQNLGYWSAANDRAVWEVRPERAGEWDVSLDYACDDGAAGGRLLIESEAGQLLWTVEGTGAWSQYRTLSLGRITLPAGASRVTARAEGEIHGALLDLRALRLMPPAAAGGPEQPPPGLEQCLTSGLDLWGELAMRQPEGPTFDFFAGLLPPPRYVNTDFRHYPIVLSAPNAAVKARFVSNGGGVNRLAGTSTWRDAGLVPVAFLVGQEHDLEAFGADPARLDGPRLAAGWMPIVSLTYEHKDVRFQQEAYAGADSDDALVSVRFSASAPGWIVARIGGSEPMAWQDGSLALASGRLVARTRGTFAFAKETRELIAPVAPGAPVDFFFPTRGDGDPPMPDFAAGRDGCAAAWSGILAGSASVSTGEARVDAAWRALIAGTLTLAQGDVLNYSAGNLYETTFEAECGDAARSLIAWGVPGAERFVPPLLARPLQGGIFLNDVAYKLQLLAWTHFFRRDPAWTRAQLPLVLPEAERALGWIDARTGLVPAQAYCGDIQTPCDNLYANAAFWRGLRDLGLMLADLGGAEAAQSARFAAAAAALRSKVLDAVGASERNDADPPFIPVALFGVEQPYGLLTETMQGAYWNLVAPFVYDSGIFGPGSPRTAAMVNWQLRRGGLCMGMSRFHQHSGLFANEDGLDDLYTLRLVEELLKRDDPDRALVSFYGKLAQGMTRDTCIGCEGSGMRPLDAFGRAMYLPPNAAANAFFLLTLRHLLVQDFDLDCDGRPDALRLLYATPRGWLADGGRIALERMPTVFGPVSLEVRSELARGRVQVRLDLPAGLQAPARLKLRLPAGTERADGAGEIVELAPGGGRREFEVLVRPSSR